jgi:3-phenylpropionate/trans-cinnamate dioxygenase ferredoxin reductase component
LKLPAPGGRIEFVTETIVIVGAGLAGAKAAATLREEGFDGPVLLLGREPVHPYERPPLSKGLLLGSTPRDDIFVNTLQWYADHAVELRTEADVVGLDAAERRLTLADGSTVDYEKLLLATGSSPRSLRVPGAELDGVLSLRTLAESDRISQALKAGTNVVIIGAGWIGLEIASAARQRDANVTIVEVADLPLQRVLGDEVARVFLGLHESHAVGFRLGAQVASLQGVDGRVSGVTLADGTVLPADVVVVGVGITPNVELAEQAGLEVNDGVVVDAGLRTSDPNIWAAGDVASAYHPLLERQIRVEHWANALNQGPVAAKSMMGQDAVYDLLPYFFTDQYDLGMEYSGYAAPGEYDRVVFRGDPESGEFLAFWTKDGRVLAGMSVNIWEQTDAIQDLIRSKRPVDLDRLADPARPLTEVF